MSLERGPEDPGAPVTAYNWQDPPFNRWAFWHVDELLPTYLVARGSGPAGSGAGWPAGIGWLGMSSRMCRNAQRWNGGSCQLARVTCDSGAGGKPAISTATPSGEAAGVCEASASLVMVRTLTHR